MSHSAEKSTFDAIEISEKPIAITHANPSFWHNDKRNKSKDDVSCQSLVKNKREFKFLFSGRLFLNKKAIL